MGTEIKMEYTEIVDDKQIMTTEGKNKYLSSKLRMPNYAKLKIVKIERVEKKSLWRIYYLNGSPERSKCPMT